jgi:hypothetical protein
LNNPFLNYLLFQSSKVPKFQSSKVPKFQSSKVPKFQSFKVPKFQSSKVSKFQSSKVPKFQNRKTFTMSSAEICQCTECQKLISKKPNKKVEIWHGLKSASKTSLINFILETKGHIVTQCASDDKSVLCRVQYPDFKNYDRIIISIDRVGDDLLNKLKQDFYSVELWEINHHGLISEPASEPASEPKNSKFELFKSAVDHSTSIDQFKKIAEACDFRACTIYGAYVKTFEYLFQHGTEDQIVFMAHKFTNHFIMYIAIYTKEEKFYITFNERTSNGVLVDLLKEIVYVCHPAENGPFRLNVFHKMEDAETYKKKFSTNSQDVITPMFIS